MKNFTSILGWLLLIAVLAVPSFLFYNWLSKSKLQNQAELANEPMAGSVFPSEKSSRAAAAPLQPAAKPEAPKPAVQPAAGQPAPGKTAPQEQAAAEPGGPMDDQPPSASSNPPAAAVQPAQAPAVSTAAQPAVAVSTAVKPASYFNPQSTRDPTFTPDDYRRIKEEQQQREEAERMRREAESRKPRDPGPEVRISLQGIVGSAAIINGDMYSVGQTVRGVKILKIGADYIIAEYKGKKFKKVLK